MENSEFSIRDQRKIPIFIHSELDDLGLTPEAFRVYCHLVRRAGNNGQVFPTMRTIGEKCFPALQRTKSGKPCRSVPAAVSQRRMALNAIEELEKCRLIRRVNRFKPDGGQTSNVYILLDKSAWCSPCAHPLITEGSPPTTPHDHPPDHTVITPLITTRSHKVLLSSKGSPPEGNPLEVSPSENFSEQPKEKPSPVNQPPIVETSKPTTTGENPPPQSPPARESLQAEIRAVYERCKPPTWVSSPTWTTSLDSAIFATLRDVPDRADFLGRLEMALKFASQDFALSKKTGTIGDLFKYGNLVEWSDKGRSLFPPDKPALSSEEAEAKRSWSEQRLRHSQLQQQARDAWVRTNYPENKLVGVKAWTDTPEAEKQQIIHRYTIRLEQVAENARVKRHANHQGPAASVQGNGQQSVA